MCKILANMTQVSGVALGPLVFKVLHGMAPEYLNVFKSVHEVSTRNTRQSSNTNLIYITKAKTMPRNSEQNLQF
jgi:hypothetical protein